MQSLRPGGELAPKEVRVAGGYVDEQITSSNHD